MSVRARNNVKVMGQGDRAIIFAHGYGCDQNMWRFITPAFEQNYRIILFDHVGAGRSDPAAYDRVKYSTLQGYADDILEICEEFGVERGVCVGHSVSATIALLAAVTQPERFGELVLIGPSPRYINDDQYVGGFSEDDIRQLLEFQESNFLGWSSFLAEKVVGDLDRPDLVAEVNDSFCRMDPEVARQFAAVTFLSDNRSDLERVPTRSLVIQSREDIIAPLAVGQYVTEHLPNAELVVLDTVGHSPHLSAPAPTIAAMNAFLEAH